MFWAYVIFGIILRAGARQFDVMMVRRLWWLSATVTITTASSPFVSAPYLIFNCDLCLVKICMCCFQLWGRMALAASVQINVGCHFCLRCFISFLFFFFFFFGHFKTYKYNYTSSNLLGASVKNKCGGTVKLTPYFEKSMQQKQISHFWKGSECSSL